MHTTTVIDNGTARITPHGDLGYDALPGLHAETAALPGTVHTITWDMCDTPFMDVAALHLFRDQRQAARLRARTLTVTGLRPQPRRLLLLAAELFPAVHGETAAAAVPPGKR
ncbi:STAS domain-containing protein [Streptomyces sp. NPDC005805]|uniref:STAS domain-containing protein n=1 Tax=Streptomyces sp. NPDC005805 TaxID=3157068 RepID=UPI0033CF8B67